LFAANFPFFSFFKPFGKQIQPSKKVHFAEYPRPQPICSLKRENHSSREARPFLLSPFFTGAVLPPPPFRVFPVTRKYLFSFLGRFPSSRYPPSGTSFGGILFFLDVHRTIVTDLRPRSLIPLSHPPPVPANSACVADSCFPQAFQTLTLDTVNSLFSVFPPSPPTQQEFCESVSFPRTGDFFFVPHELGPLRIRL